MVRIQCLPRPLKKHLDYTLKRVISVTSIIDMVLFYRFKKK